MEFNSPLYLSLRDEKATEDFGRALASLVRVGDLVLLQGDLGMGKSVLARSIIRALNPLITEVPSPTFTLVQHYETPRGRVDHYDLYRLESHDELVDIGFDDSRAHAITIVEWPERLRTIDDRAIIVQLKAQNNDAPTRDVRLFIPDERKAGLVLPESVTLVQR